MTFPEMAAAILRKWWVFVAALVVLVPVAFSLRGTGAEFIADAWITVTLPRDDNTLLASSDDDFRAPAILAAVTVLDDTYRSTIRAEGLPDTFEIDYRSQYPVVIVTLRGPTSEGVGAAVERVAADYIALIDDVQAERDVVGGARVRGTLTALVPPTDRAAGSTRALAGLLFGSLMLAGGLAYGADQFLDVSRWGIAERQGRPARGVTLESS
ncbi:MAG: hypothetical protein AAGA37_10870 [Actinomycetota bacterium]